MTTFKENYNKKIIPELQKELKLDNIYAVPRIQKIKINVGIGSYITKNKDFAVIIDNIAKITGQKPVVTKSKKAISNFKLREGVPNGVCLTLRGAKMMDFLNKLINVVFPRIRDFRGLSEKSFDGHGSYSLGIKEHNAFPEIKVEDLSKNHGIQITIVTTSKEDNSARLLLSKLGFPFKKNESLL